MYTLKVLQDPNSDMAHINGKWVPARPINWTCRTWRERFVEAYKVFVGKADAFTWPEGQ